jgi:hypothetical protein
MPRDVRRVETAVADSLAPPNANCPTTPSYGSIMNSDARQPIPNKTISVELRPRVNLSADVKMQAGRLK